MSCVFDVEGVVVASAVGHLESEPSDAGPSAIVTGMRLSLPRAASFTGEVAADATLLLLRLDAEGDRESTHSIAPESDESSAFRVAGLRPGRYAVRVAGGAAEPLDLGVHELAPGETVHLGDVSAALGPR
jgi:hypothetical protein